VHRDAYGDAYGDAYASCRECGEYADAALRMIGGVCLCLNCADAYHRHVVCAICTRYAASEQHHVATRGQNALTIPVCLNCHAILSRRQYQWCPAWRLGPPESRPLLYLVQGVLDVVTVWCERSPVADQSADLTRLLGRAALLLLPYLRPDALRELSALVPVGVRP